jgi:hypothetical protein
MKWLIKKPPSISISLKSFKEIQEFIAFIVACPKKFQKIQKSIAFIVACPKLQKAILPSLEL